AECCYPIPGDEVMGFIDDNGEVVVHALTCPRAQVLKAGFGSRIVATSWEGVTGKSLAHVRIEGIDRHGILQELIQMISTHMAIDIRKLNIEAHDEVFNCDLWVRVGDVGVVSSLCEKVLSINGVQNAARIH
ncbi:MAG: GTP pyrophosphokinase, partial [Muribaculaceae bacterium]|nr:GTP pyrophosphokinase [Muribaculaceae bacterium]